MDTVQPRFMTPDKAMRAAAERLGLPAPLVLTAHDEAWLTRWEQEVDALADQYEAGAS